MGVFKERAKQIWVSNNQEFEQAAEENPDFKISGSLHSYNRAALHHTVIHLEGEFKNIVQMDNGNYMVGAGATIEEVAIRLMKDGRRLLNSGNHMKQTLVGAMLGGTHGFGPDASMVDMIVKSYQFDGYTELIRAVQIRTLPLASYAVVNCVCKLSDLIQKQRAWSEVAYAVLPYSGEDPTCIVANYAKMRSYFKPNSVHGLGRKIPWSWWKLRLWWAVDAYFPPLRRLIQKFSNFLTAKTWQVTASAYDIDFRYDTAPGTSGDTLNFLLWAYKPTHTSFNIALHFKPEDTEEVIKFIVSESEKIKPGMLRNFIGVRKLTTKSNWALAGNFECPTDAIDMYCSPKDAKHLMELQFRLQANFWTMAHRGKTVDDETLFEENIV